MGQCGDELSSEEVIKHLTDMASQPDSQPEGEGPTEDEDEFVDFEFQNELRKLARKLLGFVEV